MESVEVYCPPEATDRHDWIADDAWPGVRVVEGQLKPGASQVIVAVEPGARALLTGSRVPWRIEKQGPETAARAAIAHVLSQELGRTQARASNQRAGYTVNERGERVLSVRLHEKCDHKEDHLSLIHI